MSKAIGHGVPRCPSINPETGKQCRYAITRKGIHAWWGKSRRSYQHWKD